MQNRGNHQNPAKVDAVIAEVTKAMRIDLDAIHNRLKGLRYPFAHAAGQISVSDYARGKGPYEHEIQAVYTDGHSAIDHLYSLYYKVAGRLASIAELVEKRINELSQTAARSEAPGQTH